jgi:CRISPR-associated endonuclease/helicase Cas3
LLPDHLAAAEKFAVAIVDALKIEDPLRTAVILAAKHHDDGKDRPLWQSSIGNRDQMRVLAKSGHARPPENLTGYRHEFGSLIEAEGRFKDQAARDLILHLISSHHGRGRPHFSTDESFDPKHMETLAAEIARKVPRRFAQLQRQYGRWGLAYLESLVRAADALASQRQSEGTK